MIAKKNWRLLMGPVGPSNVIADSDMTKALRVYRRKKKNSDPFWREVS